MNKAVVLIGLWSLLSLGSAVSSHAQSVIDIPVSTLRLYQSEENAPFALGGTYEGHFDVGSYSKNYAMVTIVFFDVTSLVPTLLQAPELHLSVKLESVESTPNGLNIDFIGSFASDTPSQEASRYQTPALDTFANLIANNAAPGVYRFDISAIKDNLSTINGNSFLAFRFYQSGYLTGDSTTKEYHFSEAPADTRLSAVPEPGSLALLIPGALWLSFRRKSRAAV